jgi:hypothetical protein
MVRPDEIGIEEQETFVIPVGDDTPLMFMLPKAAAARLRTRAKRLGLTPAEWVGHLIERHIERGF